MDEKFDHPIAVWIQEYKKKSYKYSYRGYFGSRKTYYKDYEKILLESVGIFILIAFGLTFIKNVFVKFNFGKFISYEDVAQVKNY